MRWNGPVRRGLVMAAVAFSVGGCHPAAEDADVGGPAATQQAEREALEAEEARERPDEAQPPD